MEGVLKGFFKTIINKAAKDIKQNPAEYNFVTAKEQIRNMIDTMVEMSFTIENYRTRYPGVIGEETFCKAKQLFCPKWPICESKIC